MGWLDKRLECQSVSEWSDLCSGHWVVSQWAHLSQDDVITATDNCSMQCVSTSCQPNHHHDHSSHEMTHSAVAEKTRDAVCRLIYCIVTGGYNDFMLTGGLTLYFTLLFLFTIFPPVSNLSPSISPFPCFAPPPRSGPTHPARGSGHLCVTSQWYFSGIWSQRTYLLVTIYCKPAIEGIRIVFRL